MDPKELAAFVERAMTEADQRLGRPAPPAVLEQYAREAALDLWVAGSQVTVLAAAAARRKLREAMGLDAHPRAA